MLARAARASPAVPGGEAQYSLEPRPFQDRSRVGANADFRTATSALGSGEFEVELASVPPGDGGVGGQVGVAEDG